MARPRKSEERNTRQDILDAALSLFAEKSFFGSSMRDVARRVGVRESALYHHFDSKAAILTELLTLYGPGHAAKLTQLDLGALIDAYGGKGLLQQLANMMLSMWTTEHEQKMFRILLTEGPRMGERDVLNLPNFMRGARQTLSVVFTELMRRKLIRKADPIVVTMAFFAPMMMLRILYLVMPKEPHDLKSFKAEVDAFIEYHWQSIK